VIGYVSKINDKDVERLDRENKLANYAATHDIGKLGIERYYEDVRATSTTPDIIIMSILLIQCLLGLSTIPFSAQYPDGSEMMKL
ncbi:hypothetical protein MJL79_31075, partial [Salmonella enterica subsp. enterica serovar Montevideo]|nr:hypothetical protein [Salmonella enterica subsp. enterica serovar Montevideo]